MRPTEILMHEHRVIEQVLTCVERIAEHAVREGRVDGDSAREAIDFLRTFADRCHHGKEEEQLFPMMEERGFSADEGPTRVMRDEHVQGRALIRAMDESIDGAAGGAESACRTFAESARRYVLLLREHIEKEDHCLFPMADRALTEADQAELGRRFARVEHDDIGDGVHERYVRLAEALAARWDVPATATVGAGGGGCGHTHGS